MNRGTGRETILAAAKASEEAGASQYCIVVAVRGPDEPLMRRVLAAIDQMLEMAKAKDPKVGEGLAQFTEMTGVDLQADIIRTSCASSSRACSNASIATRLQKLSCLLLGCGSSTSPTIRCARRCTPYADRQPRRAGTAYVSATTVPASSPSDSFTPPFPDRRPLPEPRWSSRPELRVPGHCVTPQYEPWRTPSTAM